MNAKSFFEIGGELIELEADYNYGVNQDPTRRKQQRAIAREVKSAGKAMHSMSKTATKNDTWGPAETLGYGIGLGAGVVYATATFPVVLADSPLIGPADLLWFASSIKFMQKSTAIGKKMGEEVDQTMGWD
jgi:hypothetical protein